MKEALRGRSCKEMVAVDKIAGEVWPWHEHHGCTYGGCAIYAGTRAGAGSRRRSIVNKQRSGAPAEHAKVVSFSKAVARKAAGVRVVHTLL